MSTPGGPTTRPIPTVPSSDAAKASSQAADAQAGKFATPDRGDAIVAVARNAEGVSEDENGVPSDENTPDETSGDQSMTPAEPDVSTDDQPGGSE